MSSERVMQGLQQTVGSGVVIDVRRRHQSCRDHLYAMAMGDGTVLSWLLRELAPVFRTERILLLTNECWVAAEVRSACSGLDVRILQCDGVSSLEAYSQAASLCDEPTVFFINAESCLLPSHLFVELEALHRRGAAGMSAVVGLPQGLACFVYETDTIRSLPEYVLPNLPSDPGAILRCLQNAVESTGSELPIRVGVREVRFGFDVSADVSVREIPESMELDTAQKARQIFDLYQDEMSGAGRLAKWKALNVRSNSDLKARVFDGRCSWLQEGGPKRILFVSPRSGFSGGEESMCLLAGNLDRGRYTPFALIGTEGHFTQRLRECDVTVFCLGRDMHANPGETLAYTLELLTALRPHVVHQNSFDDSIVLWAAAALGIPVVQHVRVSEFSKPAPHVTIAKHVIAVSDFVRNRLLSEFDLAADRVTAIHNGIDPEWFAPAAMTKAQAREKLGLDRDAPTILMIARFVPNKRHDVLIDAVSRLADQYPDLQCVLVGETFGDCDVLSAVRCAALEKGILPRLRILPFQRDIRLVHYAADIFALPSEGEPFARCMLEAMALAKPIVTVASGGHFEQITDSVTGLIVRPGDGAAFADALRRLLADADWATGLGVAARAKVERTLTIQRTADRTMDLYDMLAKTDHAAPCYAGGAK